MTMKGSKYANDDINEDVTYTQKVLEDIDEECEECGGRLEINESRGEAYCVKCGLVVIEDGVDKGPEWREFNNIDSEEKRRVGAPTTKMLHDKGLSTNISWQNKDAYGVSLSPAQRKKMERLRKWNERFRTKDYQDRNLKQALGEINRMSSALGLPDVVRNRAAQIYRDALENDLLPGRSIESMTTAALYVSARQNGTPRTFDELEEISQAEKKKFQRCYRYIVRELDLIMEPVEPEEYISRIISNIEVEDSDAVERETRRLLKEAKKENIHSGKNPITVAAGAVYAGSLVMNENLTQKELGEVADVSEVTIRNRYREILDTVM